MPAQGFQTVVPSCCLFTPIGWNLTPEGRCQFCGTTCACVFEGPPERWGARRMPVRLAEFPAYWRPLE